MQKTYLEVTFSHGRPVAAYLYLPRDVSQKSVRTVEFAPGILVDYGSGGEPIGLELTSPQRVTLDALNAVLGKIGCPALSSEDLAPLNDA